MRSFIPFLPILSALLVPVHSLYFYIEGTTPKCFYEELPKGTMVVGDYTAAEFNDDRKEWLKHGGLNMFISVEEVFDNDHRVVSQKGAASGRFTFTSDGAGEHRICFTPSSDSAGSWLLGGGVAPVRMNLDMAIGDTGKIESSDKGKIEDIVQKVKDLNARLGDIRREQVFQREREAEFRDQSESTNARVVRWTIIQLIILGVTCAWQLSHLRSFFIKQKLT